MTARDGAAVYREAFQAGIAPDREMPVSQWSAEYRYLSAKGSAEPGRYRPERTPYWIEPLDALSKESPVQEIIVMKGAQVGFSEMGLSWLGYIIHHAPAPTMMVLPTVELAERTSKQRIAPMIDVSPVLKERVNDPRSRDSGNTLLVKEFAGGFLVLVGANSASGLRSTPIKNLILDEEDSYPADVEGEGSPADLAKKRTATFPRRKILRGTTPTMKGASAIESAFLETDQRYYYVPCPHCDAMQVLRWANVRWEKKDNGKPDQATVRYECEACGEGIKNHQKTAMLARGEWRATAADTSGGKRRGYHLSALYSPVGWRSWEEMAADWHEAQSAPQKLKTFINTDLGETYEVKGEDTPDWRRLYERREDYAIGTVPAWASMITAAIDVQKDRLEMSVYAWHRKESWLVEHVVIPGDTATDAGPWKEADRLINMDWPHESGGTMTLLMTLIDSGFNTQYVYDFVRTQDARRVRAIKGQETLSVAIGAPSKLDYTSRGRQHKHSIRLWPVGSSHLKGDLYARLKAVTPTEDELKRSGYPATYVHFPMVEEEFFKQLVSEKLILHTNKATGRSRTVWVKTNPRNETLDLACYNIAAWHGCGCARWTDTQWETLAMEAGARRPKTTAEVEEPTLPKPAPASPPQKPKPAQQRQPLSRRSSFW